MRFCRDQDGFTGAERALILCVALALIVTVGALLQGGSVGAARDARRALVTRAGGGGLPAVQALSAAPGTLERPGALQVTAASAGTYTVQPGDSLSAIAERELGDASRWPEIYALNRDRIGGDPGMIQVGQELRLPGGPPGPPPGPPVPPADPGGDGISIQTLQRIMPNLPDHLAAIYIGPLNQAMREYGINTPTRQAAFLAQLAHESIELTAFEELADGSDYEGRCRDLGNCHPGDGRRYKGRGPIQLTGRANYRRVGNALGLDLEGNPGLAATPEVGFRVAGYYWQTHGLNELADQGNFREITRRINGGYNGLPSREAYHRSARRALGL